MEYPAILDPVLARIDPTFGKHVDCESGWWDIIALCNKELSQIDPEYSILQVKEKFGGLRFYFRASDPSKREQMNRAVAKYEKICSMTCERTGYHGYLMVRNGVFKTLSRSFIDDGWAEVSKKEEEPSSIAP